MPVNLEASLIRICNNDGETTGTGFVVSDTLAVTCAHVVEACGAAPSGHVRIVFHLNGQVGEAEVLHEAWCASNAEDIAVLRLADALPQGVEALKLGRTLGTERHQCVTLGYPNVGALQGLEGRGEIYRLVSEVNGRHLIQVSSKEITNGFSGAPLLDQVTERVVGMITQIANPDRFGRLGETAFAIPSECLHAILVRAYANLKINPPKPIEEYLAAVYDYCTNLPYLTLHDIRPPKMLDEVYVPLKARVQRNGDKEVGDLLSLGYTDYESLSIAEVVRQNEYFHLIILGEPGAGKSTLLRQIAQCAWEAPEKIGLATPHLPILIPLQQLCGTTGSLSERLSLSLSSELSLMTRLPDGFFDSWAEQTGANWVILLDALDEIVTDERAHLIQWLKGLLKTIRRARIIITSRPSGYVQRDFDDRTVGHFEILPFTATQTAEFSHRWFGDRSSRFLRELDRIRAGDLKGTPLLLTIAAKVYLEAGMLPERRSELYKQFIDILLSEAEKHGLRAELGERICKVAKLILSQMAVASTGNQGKADVKILRHAISEHLNRALGISKDEAEAECENFIHVMARRSGVFTQRGGTYDFLHPTFREYLAAYAIKHDFGNSPEVIWERILSKWLDPNWREVALFVFLLLSDEKEDSSSFLRRIFEAGEEGVFFAGRALAEQVKVNRELCDSIIDNLLSIARTTVWVGSVLSSNPIAMLGEIYGNIHVVDGLNEIVCDDRVDTRRRREAAVALGQAATPASLLKLATNRSLRARVRESAVFALKRLRLVDELVRLAQDPKLEAWIREQAIVALIALDHRREASESWVSIINDPKVRGETKMRASIALGQLGLGDESKRTWLALAGDSRVTFATRESALEMLKQNGDIEGILAISKNRTLHPAIRRAAAAALTSGENINDLLNWVRSRKTGIEISERVIELLAEARRVEDLVSLSGSIEPALRVRVAEALAELHHNTEAFSILINVAFGKKVSPRVRNLAATTLLDLEYDKLAAAAFRILALDERVPSTIREQAAEALGELGFIGKATCVLRELTDKREIDPVVRIRAAEALATYRGKKRAASFLFKIARDGKLNPDIRQEAIESLIRLEYYRVAEKACMSVIRNHTLSRSFRRQVAFRIGTIGGDKTLLQLLRDRKMGKFIKEEIIDGLESSEAISLLQALEDKRGLEPWIREHIAEAVDDLDENYDFAEDNVDTLLNLAQDRSVSPGIRVRSIKRLGWIGEVETVPQLEKLQKGEKNKSIRLALEQAELMILGGSEIDLGSVRQLY